MSDKPIMFTAAMVRAILDGRKTQTRRLLKTQPAYPGIEKFVEIADPFHVDAFKGTPAEGSTGWTGERRKLWWAEDHAGNLVGELGLCPYGRGGNHLWVRETWRAEERTSDYVDGIRYAADGGFVPIANTFRAATGWVEANDNGRYGKNWRPSSFMKPWMSRIHLEVTDVRVERLQAITEEDARAEGVQPFFERFECVGREQCLTTGERAADAEHRASFAALWDEIIGDRANWKSNPWVWVIAFTPRPLAPHLPEPEDD